MAALPCLHASARHPGAPHAGLCPCGLRRKRLGSYFHFSLTRMEHSKAIAPRRPTGSLSTHVYMWTPGDFRERNNQAILGGSRHRTRLGTASLCLEAGGGRQDVVPPHCQAGRQPGAAIPSLLVLPPAGEAGHRVGRVCYQGGLVRNAPPRAATPGPGHMLAHPHLV